MTAPIPDHTRAQVVVDYQTGMSQLEVATKHGLGAATVHRIIKSAGAERGRKFTADVLDEAVQDYLESGDSMRNVARRHPLSEDTLRIELKRRELTRPAGSTTPASVKEAAIDDFVDGMSVIAIAAKRGLSRSTVAAWITKEGVSAPDRTTESPGAYDGGWVMRGLIKVPLEPVRSRVA